jgi:hypothetical protein
MKIEFAEGQEGSAVSKTRRFQKKTSKQRAMHDVIWHAFFPTRFS